MFYVVGAIVFTLFILGVTIYYTERKFDIFHRRISKLEATALTAPTLLIEITKDDEDHRSDNTEL